MEPPKGEQTWLEKRSRTEKYLMVATSILTVIIVLLIIGLSCQYSGRCNAQEKELCVNPQCLKTAEIILESLDRNVDPCHDFYRFACGNKINNTVLPQDTTKIDSFDIINDKIREQLRTILESPIENDEIKPIALVKKYFQACMNEKLIEKQGTKFLVALHKVLGGWPVLEEDSWREEEFEWTKVTAELRKLGLGSLNFVELTVDPDPLNSSVRIVELDQAHFGLSRPLLTTNSNTDFYLHLMIDIAVQLGANRTRAEEELKESLDFEIKLANISVPPEKRRDFKKLVTHMSIKELKMKYPKTPWLEFINNMLLVEAPLTDDDIILVVVPSYFSAFENLIGETPKRAQANYVLWRVTQDLVSYLPDEVYQHFLKAVESIDGQAQRPERWKECTQTTYDNLPLLVSSLYVRKYFDEDAKKNASEMVGYLKNAFKDILRKLDWMDDATRQRALEKANKMVDHVGYPSELLDNSLLEKHFENLETYADQYLKSFLNIQLHGTNFKYNLLRRPVNKTNWIEHGSIASAGASFRPLENSIFFPAGILQGIFFNKNRPRYMNFGGIGTIIGHEITHGFDDEGRQLDGDGILVNWWDPKTEKAFLSKAECIIYQYGNYTVPEVGINIKGVNTQGENIADNGGLKEAYLAYNAWVKNNKEEPKLPGLEEFSTHQLFWISAAMNWCTNYKSNYLKNLVASDSHSPNEFRVLGPFSNSAEFAKDFNCKSGSRMNPIKKCAVW